MRYKVGMKMQNKTYVFWETALVFILFFVSNAAFAQESCGNFVEIYEGERYETPIENCENPFNADSEFVADGIVFIHNQEVGEGATLVVSLNEEVDVDVQFAEEPFYSVVYVYRNDGDDYIFSGNNNPIDEAPITFTEPGTHTAVIVADVSPPVVSSRTFFQKVMSFFFPVAQAYFEDYQEVKVLTFEVKEETPEPDIDPLILQYEPVLYLHPDEDYQPMNVEAFIQSSSLWDDNGVLADSLVKEADESDPVTMADLIDGDSEDWYLSFSDTENAKSFDLEAAKDTYDDLVSQEKAVPTYYAYKMEDSYTDDEGIKHEFIVLQYWYFYAFNNWAEQLGSQGLNNHEGDWESVFVFLDKDTKKPEYLAYSSHLNDGDPDLNPTQYASVRREWDSTDTEKDGSHVESYVALGSHANYPNNGVDGTHIVPNVFVDYYDQTSEKGIKIDTNTNRFHSVEINSAYPVWVNYEGKWGADQTLPGGDGPQGPNFIDVSGITRFHHPVEWAGIDKIIQKTVEEPTSTFSFPDQGVVMEFLEDLSIGTVLSVSPHDELISFGENVAGITLLPYFWEFTSSLLNGTFEATISLEYSESDLEQWNLNADNLSVFYFNEDENAWEVVPTTIDEIENTVSFTTTHFSRYAIGSSQEESLEDLFDQLLESVKNLDLPRRAERVLKAHVRVAERLALHERRWSQRLALRSLDVLERKIKWYERRRKISSETAESILNNIEKIRKQI